MKHGSHHTSRLNFLFGRHAAKPRHPVVRRIKRPKVPRFRPLHPPRPKGKGGAKASFTSVPVVYTKWLYCTRSSSTGTVVTANSRSVTTAGFNESRTYQSNIDYKRRIAKGLDANYPYSRSGGSVKAVAYHGITTQPSSKQVWSWDGAMVGAANINANADQGLKDLALTRLKNRINGYVGQTSLMPPLAEAREIHGLVREVNGYGLKMLKDLLLIKRTHGKSALKHAGQVWLFFGFGVKPLINDIAKAAMSIQDYMSRTDRSVRVSGTASKDWVSSFIDGSNVIPCSGVNLYVSTISRHQLSYRYSGAVDITVRSSASYNVLDQLGLEFGQLPATLWELTPYSWVVDYFTTVGPWLDDVFYTLPGNLKYLSLNSRYQMVSNFVGRVKTDPGYFTSGSFQPGGNSYFQFSRTTLTSLPTRQLRVKSYDEVAKYGLTKMLNLASVLAGRLKTPHV